MTRLFVKYLLFLATILGVVAQETTPPETEPKSDQTSIVTNADDETSSPRRSRSYSTRRGADIVMFGENVIIEEGEVANDVVLIGGSARIDGKVTGDLVVIGGLVSLGQKAEISHDLVIVGGGLERQSGAKVGEQHVYNFNPDVSSIPGFRGLHAWTKYGLMKGRPLAPNLSWTWLVGAVFLFLYLVIALLFPGPLQSSVAVLETRPGSSLLTGMLAFVLFGPLIILLSITVVGLILVPFLACGAIAAFFFGRAAVYAYAGKRISGGVAFFRSPVVAVIVGAILFYLLYMLPFLGFLVWGIVALLGVGAALLAFFGKVRSEKPKPVAPPPLATTLETSVPPMAAGAPEAVAPFTQITTPRAGFWVRFLATVIDAALIVTICKVFNLKPPGFILIWSIYHIAMWTVRGATIGGMVLGLRIVQVNGQPVTLGVALVRFLASFLSAAGLLLGFFWAGWSAQKQSWHDKIAGTCVVKAARSKPAPISQPA